MSYTTINPQHYDYIMKKIRKYFSDNGLTEAYLNTVPSIMNSCEDSANMQSYYWNGVKYAQNQTTQIFCEYLQLLEGEKSKGYYNVGTSHRIEVNPVPNRHAPGGKFVLIDAESDWDQRGLINFQKGLLRAIGIHPWNGDEDFPEITYKQACLKYNVSEIGHEEEKKLCKDFNSPAVFLKDFTFGSHPFWNMKRDGDIALKVDVIIGHPDVCGQETIGSAERSCNVSEMREAFYSISNGDYCKKLFDEFGQDRVEKELEEYLALPFKQRSGMGIGLDRLIFACKSLGIFDHLDQ